MYDDLTVTNQVEVRTPKAVTELIDCTTKIELFRHRIKGPFSGDRLASDRRIPKIWQAFAIELSNQHITLSLSPT